MSRCSVRRHAIVGGFVPVILSILLLLGAIPTSIVAGTPPDNLNASDFTSTDQVIVRWADAAPAASVSDVGARLDRVAIVTDAAGEQATWLRTLAVGGDVYRLGSRLSPERIAATLGALRGQRSIAYAEPDLIDQLTASPPNDPYWTTPAPGQWDLSEGTTPTTYGIDLLGAWDTTLGAGVVVAVLDTGITTHPDLAGQTVAGYDFIANVATANDGDGRDADPSDPGDWITTAESASAPFVGCPVSPSSWHGTHVSGTIAARTNNTIGIAGIAPSAKIQPVRYLGKCGGYSSDRVDAIVWASGGTVSGVPANATPARVINISAGGSGSCGTSSQAAIDAAVSRGTVVVVAAGNNNADASGYRPANCVGVITVAATDRNGVRASCSNYGSVVEIAAPGGAGTGSPTNPDLWSTLNDGATVPGNPIYFQFPGTSMATPHVAGVAALRLAANPSLTPAQVVEIIQKTAHPFASGGCTPGCGSGIVDTAKAVVAAAVPGKPTSVTATAGNGSAGVSWTAPASNGGSAITGYTVTSSPDGKTCGTSATSCTVSGLTSGQPYTFTVTATNAAGTGPASDPSSSITVNLIGATYHALTPTRILDSRDGYWIGLAGAFSSHLARTFQVTGRGGVPANATAVTGNLTVTGQPAAGFLYIGPNAMNNPTSSTLNFPIGDDRANAVTVALEAGGTLSVTYATPTLGPTAQVIFDVTGYFTPDTSGATYHALTPSRVLDSRDGYWIGLAGAFSSHIARTFQVAGRGGVPANATAVTGNLTVTGQTAAGFLYVGPVAMNDPTTSTLNFPTGDDRANAVTVALGAGGTLSATYAASTPGPTAQVIFDVTGYFTPDGSGAKYVPLTPARVLDSRDGYWIGLAGAFSSHAARTFAVSGNGGVPGNATAITGNLTVTAQTALGFLYIGPNAMNNPTSSTLNFPMNDDRANAVTVALGAGGTLSPTYAASTLGPTTQVIFDVTGYFVP